MEIFYGTKKPQTTGPLLTCRRKSHADLPKILWEFNPPTIAMQMVSFLSQKFVLPAERGFAVY